MSMPQRKLGLTSYNVGAIGMGCMPLSVSSRPTESDGIKTIHAAYEQGVTLFDTADAYCLDSTETGHNERLLAKALRDRKDAIIATKGGSIRPEGRWEHDGRPEHIKQACEDSLRALGVEAIQLYQHHRPDVQVPYAESIGALADLKREGKVIHVGVSNVSIEQLEEARSIIEIASVQNLMNLFNHTSLPLLRRCEELGIAFLPYCPLTGIGSAGGIGSNATLQRIASKHEASPQQIALAWLLQLSPVMLPIPGASKISSIVNSSGAPHITLSSDDVAELDQIASTS